jgi:hypothetical protein
MILRAEEYVRRKDFGISLLSEESMERLRACSNRPEDATLSSADYKALSYNVLDNPKYQIEFGYAPAGLREIDQRVHYQVNLGFYGPFMSPDSDRIQ